MPLMLKKLNKCFLILAVLFSTGCETTLNKDRSVSVSHTSIIDKHEISRQFFIKNSQEVVPFYGLLESNPGGGSTSMLYSGAAGLAGFVAQVVAHATIANQAQNNKLSREQEASNLVLKKYEKHIKTRTKQSLFSNALSGVSVPAIKFDLIEESDILEGALIVDSLPVFYLSQDQGSIIIEHQLKAYYSQRPEKIVFENMAKVISKPEIVTEDNNSWLVNNGKTFLATTSQLYNISLSFLMKDLYGLLENTTANKTHKYYIGDKKFYARGSIVADEGCNGKAIRDLKGNIVVIPEIDVEKCSSAAINDW